MVLSNQPSGRGVLISPKSFRHKHCCYIIYWTVTVLNSLWLLIRYSVNIWQRCLWQKEFLILPYLKRTLYFFLSHSHHLLEILSNRDEARRSKRLTYTAKTDRTNEIAVQNNPLKSIPAYREAAKVSYSLNHFIKPGCTWSTQLICITSGQSEDSEPGIRRHSAIKAKKAGTSWVWITYAKCCAIYE